MAKRYSELLGYSTFQERLKYLCIGNSVGYESFGWRRHLNQMLYHSPEWRRFRDKIILRDNGCDLGLEGYEIFEPVVIHHINPITYEDILNRSSCIFDPENVICTRDQTHKAIHYGNGSLQIPSCIERTKNDTCPWKK